MNTKESIVEYLIANRDLFKEEMDKLRERKRFHLAKENPVFLMDLNEQYDARIRQSIAFKTAEALAIPAEYVIIVLEEIELEEFLNA